MSFYIPNFLSLYVSSEGVCVMLLESCLLTKIFLSHYTLILSDVSTICAYQTVDSVVMCKLQYVITTFME